MKKPSVLILYTLPSPFFPDGTPDIVGVKSVLSRLRAVEKALRSQEYSVKKLEAAGDVSAVAQKIQAARFDLIFNLCEEFQGNTRWEMHLAALLEVLEKPFTGSSALTLGLSQDKGKTKSLLAHFGVPTPGYQVWDRRRRQSLSRLKFPLIVKPVREDASLGIGSDALTRDEEALATQVKKIHKVYGQPALIEEYIEGRELNVSILGEEEPEVLPISEIDFSTMPPEYPRICGYAAKWLEDSEEFKHTVPRCPADLPPEIEKKVKEVSLQAYRILDCRDYARVDLRLDSDGTPYILEINANPDISPDAGISRSAKNAGYSYAEFIGKIVQLAAARTRQT